MQNRLTVSQLTKYIKRLFSYDNILSNVCVTGEISNYKLHSSGHMYFTLKDEQSLIRCAMFRTQNRRLRFKPKDGLKVIVRGYVSIYEAGGSYQLYPEYMEPDGLGNLYLAFEQLKERLDKEGLFSWETKKKIPYLPKRIGVVTSPTGAALRDIMNVLYRRYPNVILKIFPVLVQGEEAGGQISNALQVMNRIKAVDVIILARGGGSLEELWPFNEEIVARSIYKSDIPVISAVGHETDFSIADFVSDLRAPTPSAAAELVVPEKEVLVRNILDMKLRLKRAMAGRIQEERQRLSQLLKSHAMRNPVDKINQKKLDIERLKKNLENGMLRKVEIEKGKLSVLCGKMDALSPLTVLSRGYSITQSHSKEVIKSVTQVHADEKVDILLSDGKICCKVEELYRKTKECK